MASIRETFAARNREHSGPCALFVAALLLTAVAWIVVGNIAHDDLVLPIVSTLLFVLAAATALIAWSRGDQSRERLSYWDVAGAFTFIGICAAALIKSEQLIRLI